MCRKIEASFRVASLWSTFSLLVCVVSAQQMDIPDKLDPFLELLFETAECEPVVADATFLVVETRKCKPFTCNFPFEVCMRPSNLINEEKSNQCRPCITAANGGRPVPRSSGSTSTLAPTPPSTRIIGSMNAGTESSIAPNDGDDLEGDFDGNDGDTDIAKIVSTVMPKTEKPTIGTAGLSRPNRLHKLATICEQGIPNGRFCGFQLKFTFNRATGNCEQFWFPGCRTEETNDNLFDGLQQCQIATRHCTAQPPQRPEPRALPSQGPSQSQIPFLGSFVGENGNGGNQFARSFMELAGSALGNGNGGQVSQIGRAIGGEGRNEYGGGELGGRSVAPSQQPTLIGFIANTIRDVGNGAQKGGTAQGGNGAAVFTNLLQQLFVLIFLISSSNNNHTDKSHVSLGDPKATARICELPRDLGHHNNCNSVWSHKFHYDLKTNRCLPFWYLGCGGNSNLFHTLDQCKNTCLDHTRSLNKIF